MVIGEKMSVTKKPKKVKVTFVETVRYYSKYICPSCGVEYIGGVDKNTVRFNCYKCGQLLIVEQNPPVVMVEGG